MEPVAASERQLTALFLDMVAAERGGAANTLEAYSRDLDDLAGHLATRNRTILSATTADLRGYLVALADRGFVAPSRLRRSGSYTASSSQRDTATMIRQRLSKDPSAVDRCRKCSRSRRSTA